MEKKEEKKKKKNGRGYTIILETLHCVGAEGARPG